MRRQVTEAGSIGSKNNHFAGSGNVAADRVVQEFCIKTDDDIDSEDDTEEKDMYFMEGKVYCFLSVFRLYFI